MKIWGKKKKPILNPSMHSYHPRAAWYLQSQQAELFSPAPPPIPATPAKSLPILLPFPS